MEAPVKKNECYNIEITAQGTDGEGIGRIDGFTVFVKGGAVGDRAEVKILKVNKSFAYAKIEKLICPSVYRQEPKCSVYNKCGGCNLMHINYEHQLHLKGQRVYDALNRIGGFDNITSAPAVGMKNPYFYRNKTQLPVGMSKDNKIVTGFFMPRSHNICPVDICPIAAQPVVAVTKCIKEFMQKYRISAYDENTHSGIIRHIFVRTAAGGDVMVVIVTNALKLKNSGELVDELRKKVGKIVSIIQNINTDRTNLILGKHNITLWGTDKLTDTIGDLKFEISPLSFYQVNRTQTEILYKTALEFAAPNKSETVFDLYCGIGTISLCMAPASKQVVGVEISPDAVNDAKRNAQINNITNAYFYCGSAEKVVPELYSAGERSDIAVLDPPRKGADTTTLSTIIKMNPKRIVYVSCNPETLARDARFLHENGDYNIEKVNAVDMFPHTSHVETVCLLSKLKSSEHIDVELSMDELDLTAAEKKATYQEIKDYVLEHYGLKVSQLNIAQVKRKYGIIERENYNKPKSDDSKQPKCTEEKEDAITGALKHFGMI